MSATGLPIKGPPLWQGFQDPLMGTAAEMTIEENLSLAYKEGPEEGFEIRY